MQRLIHAWTVGRCEMTATDELIIAATALIGLAVLFTFGCAIMGMVESIQKRRKERK